MNFLKQSFSIAKQLTVQALSTPVASVRSMVSFNQNHSRIQTPSNLSYCNSGFLDRAHKFSEQSKTKSLVRYMASLNQMHRRGPHIKVRPPRQPLDGKPFAKGVILKTLIKKPKKPNSANRKCVLVRLSTGKEMVAYVPGIGHNLQEHNIVLVRVGRLQDVNGVKIKCVRGVYDLPHVIKKQQ